MEAINFNCCRYLKIQVIWIVFLVCTVRDSSISLYQFVKPSPIVTKDDLKKILAEYIGENTKNPPCEEVKPEIEKELNIGNQEALELYQKGDSAYNSNKSKEAVAHFCRVASNYEIPCILFITVNQQIGLQRLQDC